MHSKCVLLLQRSPATPERLRMACADHLTAPFAKHDLRPKISV